MSEIHSNIYHICKTNTDIMELEIFKFIKVLLILRMCLGLIEYFINP